MGKSIKTRAQSGICAPNREEAIAKPGKKVYN